MHGDIGLGMETACTRQHFHRETTLLLYKYLDYALPIDTIRNVRQEYYVGNRSNLTESLPSHGIMGAFRFGFPAFLSKKRPKRAAKTKTKTTLMYGKTPRSLSAGIARLLMNLPPQSSDVCWLFVEHSGNGLQKRLHAPRRLPSRWNPRRCFDCSGLVSAETRESMVEYGLMTPSK